MPSIGWSEMLLLAVVAIVVVGPKDLPRLMRVVGHWVGKARAAAREFQQAFDDMARESEMEEMRRRMNEVRDEAAYPFLDETDGAEPARPQAADGNGHTIQPPAAERKDAEKAQPGGERQADEPEARPAASH